jgi:hypothetical protein
MDARESAPSAERNKQPILEVLARVLPPGGLVLEIGTWLDRADRGCCKAFSVMPSPWA